MIDRGSRRQQDTSRHVKRDDRAGLSFSCHVASGNLGVQHAGDVVISVVMSVYISIYLLDDESIYI